MSDDTINVARVFSAVMDLHDRLKLPPLNQMPGRVWRHHLGANWYLALNGNKEPVTLGPLDGMVVAVNPYSCGVWFNGLYVGEFDSHGGVLCAGSLANEDALIQAMEQAR